MNIIRKLINDYKIVSYKNIENYFIKHGINNIEQRKKVYYPIFLKEKEIEYKAVFEKYKQDSVKYIENHRKDVYNKERQKLIKDRKLIALNATEINIVNKNFFEKILGQSLIYPVFYFKNHELRTYNIKNIEGKLLRMFEKELYNIVDETPDEIYFYKGKKIIWASNDKVTTLKIEDNKSELILKDGMTPETYFGMFENAWDYRITRPKNNGSFIDFITKNWLIIVIIIGVIILSQTGVLNQFLGMGKTTK